MPTLRDSLLDALSHEPFKFGASATQLWKLLRKSRPISLTAVYSALDRMVDEKELRRILNFGPRGGYGFILNRGPTKKEVKAPSVWKRLVEDD